MDDHLCFKKRRTLSMETLDSKICNEYDQFLNDFSNITVDNNIKLLKEIIDKLNNLETNIHKLETKIDKISTEKDTIHKLETKIDKIFTDKDITIDNLKDELFFFKEELKDLKNDKNRNNKNNDYFC